MRKDWLEFVLLTGAWLLACEEVNRRPSLTSTSLDSAESRWCSSMCSTYQRCEGSVSPTCQSDCPQWNAAYFDRSSAASLDFQSACMKQASCSVEFEKLLSDCFQDSNGALEPSAEADELCEQLAPKFFECNWFSSRESCARFHANFSPPALASELACASVGCSEFDACIDQRLFAYGE